MRRKEICCPFRENASMTLYASEQRAKGGVVICPGGGYSFLSEREGEPVAKAFNRIGYAAFVLRYTYDPHPLFYRPLQELAWAVYDIHTNYREYGMEKPRVITCGFSAGGHLAGLLGNQWNTAQAGNHGRAQRPEAQILCYPVITAGKYAHERSMTNLAGKDTGRWGQFSLEHMVHKGVPPTFLWHTQTDEKVPVYNSLLFYHALLRQDIPAELHIFPEGPHGMSLATKEVECPGENCYQDAHIAQWFDLMEKWLTALEEHKQI